MKILSYFLVFALLSKTNHVVAFERLHNNTDINSESTLGKELITYSNEEFIKTIKDFIKNVVLELYNDIDILHLIKNNIYCDPINNFEIELESTNDLNDSNHYITNVVNTKPIVSSIELKYKKNNQNPDLESINADLEDNIDFEPQNEKKKELFSDVESPLSNEEYKHSNEKKTLLIKFIISTMYTKYRVMFTAPFINDLDKIIDKMLDHIDYPCSKKYMTYKNLESFNCYYLYKNDYDKYCILIKDIEGKDYVTDLKRKQLLCNDIDDKKFLLESLPENNLYINELEMQCDIFLSQVKKMLFENAISLYEQFYNHPANKNGELIVENYYKNITAKCIELNINKQKYKNSFLNKIEENQIKKKILSININYFSCYQEFNIIFNIPFINPIIYDTTLIKKDKKFDSKKYIKFLIDNIDIHRKYTYSNSLTGRTAAFVSDDALNIQQYEQYGKQGKHSQGKIISLSESNITINLVNSMSSAYNTLNKTKYQDYKESIYDNRKQTRNSSNDLCRCIIF